MKIVRQRICRDVIFFKNCKKIFIKFGFYFVLLLLTLLIGLLPNLVENKQVVKHHARFITDLKYVLIWKNQKRSRSVADRVLGSGQSLFIKQNCPYINCYITYNRSFLRPEEFDAIIFNVQDLHKKKVDNLTMPRSPDQLYIFKSLESAENHLLCHPQFDDFFNWTWTYKLDSEIPQPLISVFNKKNELIAPKLKPNWILDMVNTDAYKDIISGKTKAVACFINNCNLKNKHKFILKQMENQLKAYNYSLDTFGPCGEKKCGGLGKCNKIIENEYYYNLVLEDSLSPDFVSEKVAKAMSRTAIPIIVSGSNLWNFLPPGAYINAKDFGIDKLGAVVDYLLKNPKKYNYFFDWKAYYHFNVRHKKNVCDLCTKLNEKRHERNTYKQFRKWWRSDFEDQCEITRLQDMFNVV